MTMSGRYPEKRLQTLAVDWLKDHWGYVETYSDVEARGARVDSVGVLNGRLALIEVKPRVSAAVVDHRADRSHSLESKIAGVLGPLYRNEADAASKAGNRVWDGTTPPLVTILTQEISDLSGLEKMLLRRSDDWHFDFTVWRWTGSAIDILASHERPRADLPPSYKAIQVPHLVGRTPRQKARSLGELIAVAEENGTSDLVSYLVSAASGYGFKIDTGRWAITLKRKVEGHTHPQVVIGAYLDASPPTGLNIGCWCEPFGITAAELPGTSAPAAGFLNTNRLVRGVGEIDAILRRFSPRDQIGGCE